MPREIDLEVNMPESVELETEVSMPGDIEVGVTLDMNDSVSAKVAEAWAVGERGGVPVSSGDETYHNNAKYYAEKIGFLAVGATGLDAGSDPTATVTTDTDPVSGKDRYNIAFGIPKGEKGDKGDKGDKGVKGDTGDAFHIVKTYASIAAMNADYSGTDVKIGEYVMIVSNVEDPDNAKVYIKGDQAYGFVVDMSGSAGIQGQQAYVWIRYAAAEPTQDSDMKSEPDAWMGIYSGTASSAPTAYTSYTWYEIKGAAGSDGDDGTSAYVHIKWSAAEPTQDSDMKSTADAWIGIYSGPSATAPTSYTSYTWYQYKGATGSPGANAYVHIRYAASEPTQDSDMKTTPDAWIGIYSGTSSTAPTTYTSYTWYQFKGTAGSPGTPGTSAYVHIKYAANEPTQDSDMKNTADAWMGIYAGTSSTAPTSYTSYTWYKIKGDSSSLPSGGAADYALVKNSSADNDVKWAKRGNIRRVATYEQTFTNNTGNNSRQGTSGYPLWANGNDHVIMSFCVSDSFATASDVEVEITSTKMEVKLILRPYSSVTVYMDIGEVV